MKMVHPVGKVIASIFWDSQGGDHDWLSCSKSHDKRCILRRRIEAASPGNRKKEARKTDSRCSAPAGQRTCPHATSCHDCCDWMWIWNPSSFPKYGFSWLLSVPKTEIPSSWYTSWKQRMRHWSSKRVLGGPGKPLDFYIKKNLILSRGMGFRTMWLVRQRSLRSACAYAQSDQSLC